MPNYVHLVSTVDEGELRTVRRQKRFSKMVDKNIASRFMGKGRTFFPDPYASTSEGHGFSNEESEFLALPLAVQNLYGKIISMSPYLVYNFPLLLLSYDNQLQMTFPFFMP